VQKIPVVALALLVLVPIVIVVSRVERTALLAERVAWNGGLGAALLLRPPRQAARKTRIWSDRGGARHDCSELTIDTGPQRIGTIKS
jgi:hypothetical protein